jgi:hypothetical protein
MVNKNASDDLGAQGKEVHAVFALDTFCVNQFEISLICQSRGFERLIRDAPAKVPSSYPAHLGVNC